MIRTTPSSSSKLNLTRRLPLRKSPSTSRPVADFHFNRPASVGLGGEDGQRAAVAAQQDRARISNLNLAYLPVCQNQVS